MYLRNQVEDPEIGAQLAQINVERQETTVTLTYQSDPAGAAKLAKWVSKMR
jgi:hypothetical protein